MKGKGIPGIFKERMEGEQVKEDNEIQVGKRNAGWKILGGRRKEEM